MKKNMLIKKNKLLIILFLIVCFFSTNTIAFAKEDTSLYKIKLDNKKNMYEKVKQNKNDFVIVTDDGNGNYSFTANNKSKASKNEILSELSEYSSNYTYNLPVQGYTCYAYGGSTIQIRFQTLVNYSVFCKHFLDKFAKHFWTLLHVQIGQNCNASAGNGHTSHEPLQTLFNC